MGNKQIRLEFDFGNEPLSARDLSEFFQVLDELFVVAEFQEHSDDFKNKTLRRDSVTAVTLESVSMNSPLELLLIAELKKILLIVGMVAVTMADDEQIQVDIERIKKRLRQLNVPKELIDRLLRQLDTRRKRRFAYIIVKSLIHYIEVNNL